MAVTGTECRLDGFQCCGSIYELSAASSVNVVHPKLVHTAPDACTGSDNIVSVGGIHRRLEAVIITLGPLGGLAGLHIEYPHIFAAAAIRNKNDLLPVGTEPGLGIKTHSPGELPGFAACKRKFIEIAHKIINDFLTSGMDIDRHPAALAYLQMHAAVGFQRQVGMAGFEAVDRGGSAGILGDKCGGKQQDQGQDQR